MRIVSMPQVKKAAPITWYGFRRRRDHEPYEAAAGLSANARLLAGCFLFLFAPRSAQQQARDQDDGGNTEDPLRGRPLDENPE